MIRARCGTGAVLVLSLVATVASGQTTLFVDAANCPGPGDGSVGDPFCLIQDGINAAAGIATCSSIR